MSKGWSMFFRKFFVGVLLVFGLSTNSFSMTDGEKEKTILTKLSTYTLAGNAINTIVSQWLTATKTTNFNNALAVDAIMRFRNYKASPYASFKQSLSAISLDKIYATNNELKEIKKLKIAGFKKYALWEQKIQGLGFGLNILSIGTSTYDFTKNFSKAIDSNGNVFDRAEGGLSATLNVYDAYLASAQIAKTISLHTTKSVVANYWANNALAKGVLNVNKSVLVGGLSAVLIGAQIESEIYIHLRDQQINDIKDHMLSIGKSRHELRGVMVERLAKLAIDKLESNEVLELSDIYAIIQNYLVLTPQYSGFTGNTYILTNEFTEYATSTYYLQEKYGKNTFSELETTEKIHVALDALVFMAVYEDIELEAYLNKTVGNGATVADVMFGSIQGSSIYDIYNTNDLKNKLFMYRGSSVESVEFYENIFKIVFNSKLTAYHQHRAAGLGREVERLKEENELTSNNTQTPPTLQITLPQNATIDGHKLSATQGDTISFQGGITAGFLRGCIHDAGDSATYTLWYIDIDGKRKSLALNFESFNQTFSFAMPSSQITMVDLAYDNNVNVEFEHQTGFCGLPHVWESVVDGNGTVESNETVNLSNGLVAHYEFEGDANDSSGNGNHGVEHGGVSYVDGVIGQAGSFDGINDYVEIKKHNLNITDSISVSLWRKSKNNTMLLQWGEACPDGNYNDYKGTTLRMDIGNYYESTNHPLNNNLDRFNVNVNSETGNFYDPRIFSVSKTPMGEDIYENLVFVFDNKILTLYKNGQKISQFQGADKSSSVNVQKITLDEFKSIFISKASLKIGANESYCGGVHEFNGFLNGELDDLRIYNRALNESEIKRLYEMGQSTSLEQFIKIDLNGKKLSKDSETWAYVYDTKTDILWENKINKDSVGLFDSSSPDYTNLDIMHDYDNRYSIDNVSTIIQRMEATSYFGISDWRLPSTQEFKNLITDLNSSSIYFPNFEGLFYTSTVVKNGVNSQTLEKIWLENGVTSVGTPTNKYRALFATDNFVLQEFNSSEAIEMIVLLNETHQDGTIVMDPLTKEWTFNQDLKNLSIDILENSYQNTLTSSDLIKDGKTLKVNLTPNANSAVNKLVLQLKDSEGNIVKVSGSQTFWSLTKNNHAPRLADGQITRLVGDGSAYLDIETYDSDGDAVTLSVEESAGGSVSLNGNRLSASFSDGQVAHTITIGLSDGKEQVLKEFKVIDFGQNSIENYYVDVASGSEYFDAIAFGTLKGVVQGQVNPSDETQRIFRPDDNVSLAEALKIVIKAEQKAGLIALKTAEYYRRTFPTWAMPYYTFAVDAGALESEMGNLAYLYPSRETIAQLIVKTLDLEAKVYHLDSNVSFADEADFSDATMLHYAKVAKAFGLFMTGTHANPQESISRAELALVIQHIFMIPHGVLSVSPQSIEYGETLTATLSDVQADAINTSSHTLYNAVNTLGIKYFANGVEVSNPMDSHNLPSTLKTLYAVLDNDGVKNIVSSPINIRYTDADNDGLQDTIDQWVNDIRYAFDENNNSIPDILDSIYNLGSNTASDTTLLDGYTVSIADIIRDGGWFAPDLDDDGVSDNNDPDIDGDGVVNTQDAFPRDASEWLDTDADGIGNNADDDDDGDGVVDNKDDLPLNANESVDTDHDGTGNNADTDDDNDGISDADERKWNFDPLDASDGGSADADGDGVSNADEIEAGSDPLDPNDTKKPKKFVPIMMDDMVIMVPMP